MAHPVEQLGAQDRAFGICDASCFRMSERYRTGWHLAHWRLPRPETIVLINCPR